jgi:hypothetical protein
MSLGAHAEAFFMTTGEHEQANLHTNATCSFSRSSDLLLVQFTPTAGRSARQKHRF